MTHDAHLFVVFGGTGDLARRKLLPALFTLLAEPGCRLLGVAGAEMDTDEYRVWVAGALMDAGVEESAAKRWAHERVWYRSVPRHSELDAVAEQVARIESDGATRGNRVLYLALPPAAFGPTIERIGRAGLARGAGWCRLVVEKPFGTDLESAQTLNETIHDHFEEEQVYRIDHYLGKETVQNLLVFRFANPLFESSWNRDRVQRVEITVAEELDASERGEYYDRTGVIGDMVQSHLAQLLTLVAMEAPSTFAADAVRDEKVKVLRSIRHIPDGAVVLGQYGAGRGATAHTPGYRTHEGVASDSPTPTYAAIKVWIDNWRWQGVPFLLRTGKAMARHLTEIAVVFRSPPVCLFHSVVDDCLGAGDVLRLVLQPDEGFSLHIDVKRPGSATSAQRIALSFSYAEEFGRIPEAYETLLADVVEGDQTLFVRHDEVEESWRLFAPLSHQDMPLHGYQAGSWGPSAADALIDSGPKGWFAEH